MADVAIGIDIGGTNTVIGAITQNGEIEQELSFPTIGSELFDNFFKKLSETITQLLANRNCIGIGLGSPAGSRLSGCIQAPANVPWEGSIPIGQKLQERFGLPVVIDNDANSAAIGEMVYGAARGMKNFIVITLGTGVGSGIVIDGHLLNGPQGFAGELGHISIARNGRQCGCGKKGCLETYVSATGIKRTVFELLGTSTEPSVFRKRNFEEVEAKEIATEANAGDPIALAAFEKTGDILGHSLADFAAFSEPQAFILFGGLANAKELILDSAQKAFDKNLLFLYKGKSEIKLSELMNRNAAVLGSAALVWDAVATAHE